MNSKRYVLIIAGVLALCALFYAGKFVMEKRKVHSVKDQSSVAVVSFNGKVVRTFEGDNVLEYGFSFPETATTTVENDGALVKVVDGKDMILATYFSYEGGRGYSPSDYINNTIAPKVKSIIEIGTTTIGGYTWTVAESPWSIWRIAKSDNGEWLIVTENTKAHEEEARAIVESIATQ